MPFRLPFPLPAVPLRPVAGVGVGAGLAVIGLGGLSPAHASSNPAVGLNLGCAAGYALVNLRPNSGGSRLSTSLNGLTISGGATQSVPVTCVPSPTPAGTPPVSGDGHALLGGRLNYTGTASGTPAPSFYANGSASISNTNASATVDDGWTEQALADANAVSTYISSFNASSCNGITVTSCGYSDVSFAQNSDQTLTGIGGLNFYNVNSFARNVQLNFVGNQDDYFVFNVPGSSIVTNRTWSLSGVDPSRILFNITGQGRGLTLNRGAGALGTFLVNSNSDARCLAATGGNRCNGGTAAMATDSSLYGSLIVINNGSPLSFESNTRLSGAPFNPSRLRQVAVPSPVPFLGSAMAFGWSRRLRRRLSRSRPARPH